MSRMCSLSPHQLARLDLACVPIQKALDTPYLVGSVLRGGTYRDVDVRVLLDDTRYDALFGRPDGADGSSHTDPLWLLLCHSTSEWLSQTSGLPVDFQVQRRTEANAATGDEPRNPLAIMHPWTRGLR